MIEYENKTLAAPTAKLLQAKVNTNRAAGWEKIGRRHSLTLTEPGHRRTMYRQNVRRLIGSQQ